MTSRPTLYRNGEPLIGAAHGAGGGPDRLEGAVQAAQRRGAGSDGQVAVATACQAGFRAALAPGGCSSGLLAGGQLAQGYRLGNLGRGLV